MIDDDPATDCGSEAARPIRSQKATGASLTVWIVVGIMVLLVGIVGVPLSVPAIRHQLVAILGAGEDKPDTARQLVTAWSARAGVAQRVVELAKRETTDLQVDVHFHLNGEDAAKAERYRQLMRQIGADTIDVTVLPFAVRLQVSSEGMLDAGIVRGYLYTKASGLSPVVDDLERYLNERNLPEHGVAYERIGKHWYVLAEW